MSTENLQVNVHRLLQYVAVALLSIVTHFVLKMDARFDSYTARTETLEKSVVAINTTLGITANKITPSQP